MHVSWQPLQMLRRGFKWLAPGCLWTGGTSSTRYDMRRQNKFREERGAHHNFFRLNPLEPSALGFFLYQKQIMTRECLRLAREPRSLPKPSCGDPNAGESFSSGLVHGGADPTSLQL